MKIGGAARAINCPVAPGFACWQGERPALPLRTCRALLNEAVGFFVRRKGPGLFAVYESRRPSARFVVSLGRYASVPDAIAGFGVEIERLGREVRRLED